jgi:hypothetical protein
MNRSGSKKFILGLLALVVFLVIAAGILILKLPETEMVRDSVQAELSRISGNRVAIGTIKISPSFSSIIKIKVENLSITSPQDIELFSAERMVFEPSLSALLKQMISIGSINIYGMKLPVKRLKDGSFHAGFMPLPINEQGIAGPGEKTVESGVPEVRSDDGGGPVTPETAAKVHWSIDSVRLFDGQVVFQDQSTAQKDAGEADFTIVKGELTRLDASNAFSVNLAGTLATGGRPAGSASIKGRLDALNDLSGVKEVNIECRLSMIDFGLPKLYLPAWDRVVSNLAEGILDCSVVWNRGTGLKLTGGLVLRDAVPAKPYQVISRKFNAAVDFKFDNQSLSLDKFELLDPSRFALISGTVSNVLSGPVDMDLDGDFTTRPEAVESLGTAFPKGLQLKGGLSIKGRVKGPIKNMAVDLKCDLSNMSVKWERFLKREIGDKAGLGIKGNLNLDNSESSGRGPEAKIEAKANWGSIGIRPVFDVDWIECGPLEISSHISFHNKTVEFRNGKISCKHGKNSGDLLSVVFNAKDPWNPSGSLDASADMNLEQQVLSHLITPASKSVGLSGALSVKAGCRGKINQLQFGVEAPLTGLEITAAKHFKKPRGVESHISVDGKWSDSGLEISKSRLVLAGVTVSAKGKLIDSKRNFGSMGIEFQKFDLKELGRFVPTPDLGGLSGPVEARASVVGGGAGGTLDVKGSCKLLGVDCALKEKELILANLRGTAQLDNNRLVVPEIDGTTKGVLEAPFKLHGALNNFLNADSAKGSLSIDVGRGRIRESMIRHILSKAELVGALVNLNLGGASEMLEIESVKAVVNLDSGSASTENLRLKSPVFTVGALGAMKLQSPQDLNVTMGLQTMTGAGQAIGRIPEVQKLVKRHEGLLKIMGLDKELQRFGIQQGSGGEASTETDSNKTPITIMVKLSGPLNQPKVSPVLESALDRNVGAKLKALLN